MTAKDATNLIKASTPLVLALVGLGIEVIRTIRDSKLSEKDNSKNNKYDRKE